MDSITAQGGKSKITVNGVKEIVEQVKENMRSLHKQVDCSVFSNVDRKYNYSYKGIDFDPYYICAGSNVDSARNYPNEQELPKYTLPKSNVETHIHAVSFSNDSLVDNGAPRTQSSESKVIKVRQKKPDDKRTSFREYMDMFVRDSANGERPHQKKPWSDKQRKEYLRLAHIISELILPEKALEDVRGRDLDRAFESVIELLPKSNIKPYNKMTDHQRVQAAINGDVDEDDTISQKTVKNYHKFLMMFYEYLWAKSFVEDKAIKHMRRKIPDSKSRRGAFSDSQVLKIIEFAKHQQAHSKKWPFLIMAYTGMRNGEVMQLRKKDICFDDASSIPFLLITSSAGSVKTAAAIRKIPIHDKLVAYGFLQFVDDSNDGLLFEKDSHYLTRIYADQIKRDCDIPDLNEYEETLNLYSLRHSVVTKLRGENVNDSMVKQIVGHSRQQSITDNYTHFFTVAQLKKGIDNICYSESSDCF